MIKPNDIYIGSIANRNQIHYPEAKTKYSPSEKYPEYQYSDISVAQNDIYDLVRDGFHRLGLDRENFGTKRWNPLSEIIKQGDFVLLKPNMVYHQNGIVENGIECLITHPSLVRAVLDYVLLALNGTGKILIADAPVQECDFDTLLENSGYNQLLEFYRHNNINIEIHDLRNYKSIINHHIHIQAEISNPNKSIISNSRWIIYPHIYFS